MLPPPFQNALVLTGPTGAGKTQLGIELAQRLDAEIISMDSMAVYRGMDIGTAKPTHHERSLVPHHLLDLLDPWESASVAWWLDQAKRLTAEIETRGKQVLFLGGTPLYLKALICGLFDGPPGDAAIRTRLTQEAQEVGSAALHQRLTAIDPVCAGRIHPNDLRRMIRALEVYELTNKPMSEWQTQWRDNQGPWSLVRDPGSNLLQSALEGAHVQTDAILWLDLPREELYDRINQRVAAMLSAGWVDEVKQLRALPKPWSREASKALGYQDLLDLLEGTITLEETVVRVQTRSRNFAKRQITWFRHLPGCRPASKELTRSLWQQRMK